MVGKSETQPKRQNVKQWLRLRPRSFLSAKHDERIIVDKFAVELRNQVREKFGMRCHSGGSAGGDEHDL